MLRNPAVRRRVTFAALTLISLTLLTVFFREPASGALHSVQRGGLGFLSPVQSLATKAVDPFKNGFRWTKDVLAAKRENTRMAAELESLRGEVLGLREAGRENDRLKQLLDFRDAGIFPKGATFVVARVIGRSPTRWQEWVEIDKGSADGLALNQPVVGATVPADKSLSGKGLVGKIVAIAAHAAQVQLLIDPESSAAARVQESGAEGIVVWSDPGKLIMDFVARDQPVAPKQVVITSGMGGIFPKGIPIGVVESVGEEDVNIYKQIEVRPFVDFRGIEEVMVITNPPPASADPMRSLMPAPTTTKGPGTSKGTTTGAANGGGGTTSATTTTRPVPTTTTTSVSGTGTTTR
jgi:rod shape-determining protein MreC